MVSLPIKPDNIYDEIVSIKKIVDQWEHQMGHEKLPGVDVPSQDAEEKLALLLRQLCGEMMLVAGKCHNLAVVLGEQ